MSVPSTSVLADTPVAATGKRKFLWIGYDGRLKGPILITLILVTSQLSFGILESFEKTALAIVASIATELILGRVYRGKWPHFASAYVTGISVGILLRSPEFWPYAVCSMISVTTKYVFTYQGKHIFNPSNFGVVAMLILAPFTVAGLSIQWGNNLWPMLVIWGIGTMTIWKLKRFHICATYVVSFVAFAYIRSLFTGDPFLSEVAPITGPMYQLFTFFMITDPKTTVQSRWGQAFVAFLVALVEMILRLNEFVYAPFYALFLVGPPVYLLELWWTSRKKPAPAVAGPALQINSTI